MSTQLTAKKLFNSANVVEKFNNILGKNSSAFITTVLQVVNSNSQLVQADPMTVMNAAATAASMNLSVHPTLGFAYILPYKVKGKMVAQFQIGYKGIIQLAQNSGQFKTINVTDVREGEIERVDRLTGEIVFDWIQDDAERGASPVVGYIGYFELVNGFRKTFYMTVDELKSHGKKYSKSYDTNYSMWKKDFAGMARKTVLKLMLSKYGPLTTTVIQLADQSVQSEEGKYEYPDNEPEVIDVEEINNQSEDERIRDYIESATKIKDLKSISDDLAGAGKLDAYSDLIEAQKAKIRG